MTTRSWSDNLREQTRVALSEIPVLPDGLLHMKHVDGHYGSIDVLELLANVHRIQRKGGDGEWTYDDADALIAAGWAID